MKKSLQNPSDTAEILERLSRLRPDSARQWGRMTPHQAVCHLADSFKVAFGEKVASELRLGVPSGLIKWVALKAPLPWMKGAPTLPQVDQEKGGTRPGEFDADLAELRALVERVVAPQRDFEWSAHPLFGVMTETEWRRWAYLHTDHHLRQFGV